MLNAVFFILNNGVDVDIFDTAENVAFDLWIDLFQLPYHIFNLLTL